HFKIKHCLPDSPRRTPESLLTLAYKAATKPTGRPDPIYYPGRLAPRLLVSDLYQRTSYPEVRRGIAEGLTEGSPLGAQGALPMSPIPGPYAAGYLESYLPPAPCRRLYRAHLYHQRQVYRLYQQYVQDLPAGPPVPPLQ
ncbi:putative E4 early protein, partial [Equus caballus papillomavirus 6]